ncbi:Copia type Polyprotein [Phytophthora megakarya]|uniref:Copia type Polyprotein n=1 Tax=Phytophthora megakarya TaxID=4795 RepID=A0A225WDA4_9STRA|nr:Copia type Polyprotein [Phytophthora megakarya]
MEGEKVLYGLHQSGRERNKLITKWLKGEGFDQCTTESCMYVYRKDDVVALLLFAKEGKTSIFHKLNLDFWNQGFSFWGVQIVMNNHGIKLHQTKYSQIHD